MSSLAFYRTFSELSYHFFSKSKGRFLDELHFKSTIILQEEGHQSNTSQDRALM